MFISTNVSPVYLPLLVGSLPEWGVTVLQADKEMDAGDVWGSVNFSVPHSRTLSKSAFYNKASKISKCYLRSI